MILLYPKETAIITLPKTGSSSLFQTLCKTPYNGVLCVGPSGKDPNYFDHHSVVLPQAPFKWRTMIVVRHPLQRLVSLWGHLAKSSVMRFQDVPLLTHFVDAVANRAYDFYFYQWNQTTIIGDLQYDVLIKTETLEKQMIELGILNGYGELLDINKFNQPKKSSTPLYKEVLTPEMIEKLKWWWEPDAIKFGYEV